MKGGYSRSVHEQKYCQTSLDFKIQLFEMIAILDERKVC